MKYLLSINLYLYSYEYFTVCRDGEATVAIGTIQSFGNTTVGEYPIRCRFSIIAPSNKRVQMYCPTIIVTNSNITADIEVS